MTANPHKRATFIGSLATQVESLKATLADQEVETARYRRALQHIAILDDNDCHLANDPNALVKIARDALRLDVER